LEADFKAEVKDSSCGVSQLLKPCHEDWLLIVVRMIIDVNIPR
jgi:hypothetical protein